MTSIFIFLATRKPIVIEVKLELKSYQRTLWSCQGPQHDKQHVAFVSYHFVPILQSLVQSRTWLLELHPELMLLTYSHQKPSLHLQKVTVIETEELHLQLSLIIMLSPNFLIQIREIDNDNQVCSN